MRLAKNGFGLDFSAKSTLKKVLPRFKVVQSSELTPPSQEKKPKNFEQRESWLIVCVKSLAILKAQNSTQLCLGAFFSRFIPFGFSHLSKQLN